MKHGNKHKLLVAGGIAFAAYELVLKYLIAANRTKITFRGLSIYSISGNTLTLNIGLLAQNQSSCGITLRGADAMIYLDGQPAARVTMGKVTLPAYGVSSVTLVANCSLLDLTTQLATKFTDGTYQDVKVQIIGSLFASLISIPINYSGTMKELMTAV